MLMFVTLAVLLGIVTAFVIGIITVAVRTKDRDLSGGCVGLGVLAAIFLMLPLMALTVLAAEKLDQRSAVYSR